MFDNINLSLCQVDFEFQLISFFPSLDLNAILAQILHRKQLSCLDTFAVRTCKYFLLVSYVTFSD